MFQTSQDFYNETLSQKKEGWEEHGEKKKKKVNEGERDGLLVKSTGYYVTVPAPKWYSQPSVTPVSGKQQLCKCPIWTL